MKKKKIMMEGITLPIKRTIWVTFALEGIHCYPNAATNPELESVKFLSYPHRHMFHFRVAIEVTHNQRDIEFIIFKRWLMNLYGTGQTLNLNSKSCEMIAEELINQVQMKYPARAISVSVDEDAENGCTLEVQGA